MTLGVLRRSELVSLDVEIWTFSSSGMVVTVRRSKIHQEAKSRRIRLWL